MPFQLARCPSCGGNLNITTDKDYLFCPFCGAKIIRDDKRIVIEHVSRKINETEMKKMDLEEDHDSAVNRKNRFAGICFLALTAILCIITIVCLIIGGDTKWGGIISGELAFIFLLIGISAYSDGIGRKKKK